MIGRSVGGFTIVRKLGSGGMGEVYLAEHRRIHRQVAVKVLRAELSSDAEAAARFLTEARAMSLIRHPGIVEIYDCDLADGRLYLVMELLEGESLATALDRAGNFAAEARSVAAVIGQAADALAAAHAKGIIHRDLKPENIFLSRAASPAGPALTVKILDFGVAKLAGDIAGPAPATQPGTILGTPIYMSPEQCGGAGRVDQRSDVYSLGCIFFEMLAGRPPFVAASPSDYMVAHMLQPAPAPSSVQPGIPAALDDLVARTLAKDPGARIGSMAELVSRVEELLGVKAAELAAQVPPETRLLAAAGADAPPSAAEPANARRTAGWRSPSRRERVAPAATGHAEGPRATAGDTFIIREEGEVTLQQAASERLTSVARPRPRPSRRSRRWLLAAGSAAAALIVAALVVSGASSPPRRRRPPPREVEVAAAPAPAPAPAPPAPPPAQPAPEPPAAVAVEQPPEPPPAPPRPRAIAPAPARARKTARMPPPPPKQEPPRYYLMGD